MRLYASETSPTETARDTDQSSTNRTRMRFVLMRHRNHHWRTTFSLLGSGPVRGPHKSASLLSRWHRRAYFVRRDHEFQRDKSSCSSHACRFRCHEDFNDRSAGQTPCKGTDPYMRSCGCDDCLRSDGHTYEIRTSAGNPSVARKRAVRRTSANPFQLRLRKLEESWPKSSTELKSMNFKTEVKRCLVKV